MVKRNEIDGSFTAQYDSNTCTACKQPIVKGQQIVNDGGGGVETRGGEQIWRYRHVNC